MPPPTDPAVQLDQLAAHASQRQALLRQLITPPADPVGQAAAIADPVGQAVAATQALTAGDQLRAIRNHAAHQLARPSAGGGLDGGAIGRLIGVTRQAVGQLLDRDPPVLPDTPAGPIVAAVLRLSDPAARAEAAALALADHQQRRPALVDLQHAAVRAAIAGGHITQAALAGRLGKHRSWVTSAVGLPQAVRRGPGRTAPTAPDRRRQAP